MGEEERYLTARGMRSEPLGRDFPLDRWVGVYLREESPRVAAELEKVLERAVRGPVVELLMREASDDGPLAEDAARRLLEDPRQAVRMYAIGALSRRGTRRALDCLRTVMEEERRERELRIAAAHELSDRGDGEWLAQWCERAGDGGTDPLVLREVERIVRRSKGEKDGVEPGQGATGTNGGGTW